MHQVVEGRSPRNSVPEEHQVALPPDPQSEVRGRVEAVHPDELREPTRHAARKERQSDQNDADSEEVLHAFDAHLQRTAHLGGKPSSESESVEKRHSDVKQSISDEAGADSAASDSVEEAADTGAGEPSRDPDSSDGSDVCGEEAEALSADLLQVALGEHFVVSGDASRLAPVRAHRLLRALPQRLSFRRSVGGDRGQQKQQNEQLPSHL